MTNFTHARVFCLASTLLMGLLLVALTGPTQAKTFTFDTAAEFTDNFAVNGAGDLFSWSASAGIDSGPGLDVNSAGTTGPQRTATAVLATGAFQIMDGGFARESILFEVGSNNNGSFAIGGMIGFVGDTASQFGTDPNIAVRVRNDSAGADWIIQSFSSDGTITTGNNSTAFALTIGNWYELDVEWTRDGDDFDFISSLQDMGANGSTPGAFIVSNHTGTITNAVVAADSSLFAAFRNHSPIGSGGHGTAVDNFTIVPEPQSIALGGIGLLGMLCCLSRRKSCNRSRNA